MDNINYVSKKLVAEYKENEQNDFKVIERAYIQGNNKFIIEYEGGKHSMYAVAVDFFECEPRSGAYSLNKSEFDLWKKIRKAFDDENRGVFTEYTLSTSEQLEIDLNDCFKQSCKDEHENLIKEIKDDDLPF